MAIRVAAEVVEGGMEALVATPRLEIHSGQSILEAALARDGLKCAYDLSGHYITQVSGGGWWIRGEIYAGGRHLATYENDLGTPTTFFGDGDSLGTERVETAVNGMACETITSLPFGDGLSTSGGCDPSAKYFEGKERDWESNLDNFGARFYSSQIGRFISADPDNAGEVDDDPQTWNAYSYVRNSLLNATDPGGLYCIVLPNGTYKDVGKGGQSCAEANSHSQNDKPSAIVSGEETDEERLRDLSNQIAALTSARSLDDLAQHGVGWAMTFDGLRGFFEVPGAVKDALDAARAARAAEVVPSAVQASLRAGGVLERIFQTPQGPVQVYAEITAEGSTAVVKNLAIYPADSEVAIKAGYTATRQGLRAIESELREAGFTQMRVENAYRVSGINPGRLANLTVTLK